MDVISDKKVDRLVAAFARLMGVLMLLGVGSTHAADPELTHVETDYLAFDRVSEAHVAKADRAAALAAFYDVHFRPLQVPPELVRQSDRDLAALFRAASTVAYYDPRSSRLDELQADLAQLERRKLSTPDQYRDVYGALYQARRFPEMAKFAATHADLGLSPAIEATEPVSPDQLHGLLNVISDHSVRPSVADLTHGTSLVVISNPGCHFTQYAVAAIEHDDDLKAIMSEHSVWIAPPDRNIDLNAFVSWNAAHPVARISLADSKVSWPEVDLWQTPVFLYFKDGKLVDRVIGWPKEGNAVAVKAAWAKAIAHG
jgi:hypothetical protein